MATVAQLGLIMTADHASRIGYTQDANIVATGNNSQANAYQLIANANRVITCAAGNDSAKLMKFVDDKLGMHMVTNNGAANLNLFPAVGEQITLLAVNAALVVGVNKTALLWRISPTLFTYILA